MHVLLIGLVSMLPLCCTQITMRDVVSASDIAERPFPQSLTSSQWCAAAEEAKNSATITPDLRQRYIDAASASGCYGPPPKPKPQVYRKNGTSDEDFQRARARCLMEAEKAKSASNNSNSWATWIIVFKTCMRADGWVLNGRLSTLRK